MPDNASSGEYLTDLISQMEPSDQNKLIINLLNRLQITLVIGSPSGKPGIRIVDGTNPTAVLSIVADEDSDIDAENTACSNCSKHPLA